MNQMQCLVHRIPFFSGKKCSINQDIYHNDAYPACLLVQDGTEIYKVRFPGVLNENSVQSEKSALNLLAAYDVPGIPQIIAEGIVDGIPYLVEYYIEGNSLDKIYHTLSSEDWENIAHRLASFLHKLVAIQRIRPIVFKSPEKKYDNYGDVIKASILRHLNQHTSSGIISSAMDNRIKEAISDISSIFHTDVTFLHFDIKPQNIIFNHQNKRVAFIDYEHSRMGDYTHEIFRTDMAAMRYPYFNECWQLAKQEFLAGCSHRLLEENHSNKLFYYELFYDITEVTYSVLIGDQGRVLAHLNSIEDKLRGL